MIRLNKNFKVERHQYAIIKYDVYTTYIIYSPFTKDLKEEFKVFSN